MLHAADLAAAARLGALAEREDPDAAAREVLPLVQQLLHADAASLVTVGRSVSGRSHGQLVAAEGYPDDVAWSLATEFPRTPWMGMVVAAALPPSLSTEKERTYRDGWFFCERIAPSGLRDGVSGVLTGPDGGVAGLVHVSSARPRCFGRERQEMLSAVLPSLSRLVIRCARPSAAAQLAPRVAATGAELAVGARLRCWHRDPQGWWEIRLHRAPDGLRVSRVARPRPPYRLTERELEILTGLTLALSDAALSERCGLSVRTVNSHVDHLRMKLGVASRTAAAALALREGLVSLSLPATVEELAAGLAVGW